MTPLEKDLAALTSYYRNIQIVWGELKQPALETPEAKKVAKDIADTFERFKGWYGKELDKLKTTEQQNK